MMERISHVDNVKTMNWNYYNHLQYRLKLKMIWLESNVNINKLNLLSVNMYLVYRRIKDSSLFFVMIVI